MAKIEGLDALRRRFDRLPAEVFDEVAKSVEDSAIEVTQAQKRLAPKRTGKLAASIEYTLEGNPPKHAAFRGGQRGGARGGIAATITAGNSSVRYAALVEFGTAPHVAGGLFAGADHPGARAQPFFFPAYRALRRRVKARVSRSFSRGVKKSKRG